MIRENLSGSPLFYSSAFLSGLAAIAVMMDRCRRGYFWYTCVSRTIITRSSGCPDTLYAIRNPKSVSYPLAEGESE